MPPGEEDMFAAEFSESSAEPKEIISNVKYIFVVWFNLSTRRNIEDLN